MESPPIRVAVVGTGLAGLVTGYLLQTLHFEKKDRTPLRFEVELFEKSPSLGMDNSSISIDMEGGSFRLDTPMRSINGGSHSNVFRLYKHLDVALRQSDFSYSFSRLARIAPRPTSPPPPPYSERETTPKPVDRDDVPAQTPCYIYEGSNGMTFPPLALPSPVASASVFTRASYLLHLVLLSLSYLHLLLLAFFYSSAGLTRNTQSPASRGSTARRIADGLRLPNVADESLEMWCRRHWLWSRMVEEVLVPLYAAVSTVGRIEARDMPVGECLDYIVSTFGSSHFVAEVGVQQVVRRLAAPLPPDSLHVSSTITGIKRTFSASRAPQLELSLSSSATRSFDHVVFATQANQAAALLSFLPSTPALASLIAALNTFSYVPTLVVNHTDESVLPPVESDRRDLNLASFAAPSSPLEAKLDRMDQGTDLTMPVSSVQATHIISRTHPRLTSSALSSSLLLQTTNPLVPISPAHILSSTWYERAKVCRESKAVLPRFMLGVESGGDLQGAEDGIWLCGSWCAEGIPLLEGCVTSAMEVVKAFVEKEGGKPFEMPF